MFALGPRSRAALVAGGVASFALAYATTPFVSPAAAVPLVADVAADGAAPVALSPLPTAFAAVLPRRDPFVGEPDPQPSTAPVHVAAIPTLPPLPVFPGAIGALPPNAGAGAGPIPGPLPAIGAHGDTLGARVTAIVTGPHPYALVEEPGGTRVVAPGESIAGDRITAIDAAGVHLAHGTTLAIVPTGQSTGTPSAGVPPIPIPLGGLP